jgi:hypothetical protein
MSSVTGVEIGPGYCVLVRARQHESDLEVTAARVFESAEWPDDSAWQVQLLSAARRELGLPRRATLVAWNSPDAASSAEALLGAAGFTVEHVLRPVDALALLGWSHSRFRGSGAVAWLSINHHGAAVTVLRDADLLYAREFSWPIQASEQRVQAHLLQRYLYVAQLTPELRRAIQEVQDQHGVPVETAVACGNVADLRMLTMPLIRELDVEIDTLDSMDGLRAPRQAAAVVGQSAPAIRLAGAAAAFGEAHPRKRMTRQWAGAAAGLVLAAGAAWWAFTVWAAHRPYGTASNGTPSISVRSAEPSEPIGTSAPSMPEPEEPPPPAAEPPSRPQGPTGLLGSTGRDAEIPLPSVDGVLIASDRRLAVIDGAVVGVGDRVGLRTVARIELEAVVLREPSGREVRVPVRTRPGRS